jgi:hypothetical protein
MAENQANLTRKKVINQLQKMFKDPKYAAIIKKGKRAKLSYRVWKVTATSEREALHKIVGRGLKRMGTKGVLKKVVPIISIVFIVQDVRAKGPVGGVANTLFDATPYMGWVKLVTECVWGDWIPDADDPEQFDDYKKIGSIIPGLSPPASFFNE